MTQLLFVGGDNRSKYAANYLNAKGFTISVYDPYYAKYDEIKNAKTIILPVPVSTDGVNITGISGELLTVKKLSKLINANHLIIGGKLQSDFITAVCNAGGHYIDLLNVPKYVYKNARFSAEGLLCKMIECTPFSMNNANVLLLGYGRCGFQIAALLKELGANVYVFDKDPEKMAFAQINDLKLLENMQQTKQICFNADLIINSVTDDILTESFVTQLKPEAYIFNISSVKPMITTDSYFYSLHYFDCPRLPGKYVPQSAGYAIGEAIYDYLAKGGTA